MLALLWSNEKGRTNPTSSCDNVFLKHLIAIRLQKWGKMLILPFCDLNEEGIHFDMFSDDTPWKTEHTQAC